MKLERSADLLVSGVVLGLLSLLAAGCVSSAPVSLLIDLPSPEPFPWASFERLIIVDLKDAPPATEVDAGRTLAEALAAALGRASQLPVSRRLLPPDERPGTVLPTSGFDATGAGESVCVTGTARLTTQTRKALQQGAVPVDGPFKLDNRGLIERRRYEMAVDLRLFALPSGRLLFERAFREEKEYLDTEKPADFALAELADLVRDRLLRALSSSPAPETRVLLRR